MELELLAIEEVVEHNEHRTEERKQERRVAQLTLCLPDVPQSVCEQQAAQRDQIRVD